MLDGDSSSISGLKPFSRLVAKAGGGGALLCCPHLEGIAMEKLQASICYLRGKPYISRWDDEGALCRSPLGASFLEASIGSRDLQTVSVVERRFM